MKLLFWVQNYFCFLKLLFWVQKLLLLYLVQNLLVFLFETVTFGTKRTCVIFGTKLNGIII